MRSEQNADNNRNESKQERGASRFIRPIAITLAVAAAFLIGCFLVGPLLSRIHPAPITPADTNLATPPPVAAPNVPITTEPQANEPIAEVNIVEKPTSPFDKYSGTPVGSEPEPPATASQPAPPAIMTPQEPPEEPATTNAASIYRVRAGLFMDSTKADALANKLATAGFKPTVHQTERSGQTLYSVQVGAFSVPNNADALADDLRKAGFEATVTEQR